MLTGRLFLVCTLLAGPTAAGSAPDGSARSEAVDPAGDSNVRPLPFFYDLYTFRGRDGGTAIVTAFAVEAGRLETEAAHSGVRYRFSVSVVLADMALRSVSGTHDTVFVEVPRAMPGDNLLYTHVEVLAPPSTTTQQRVIMNDATSPGIGQLYTESFPIPDYTGSELMLSDIALGQPDAESGWKRGDVTLALLPTTQFPSSAFDVYYEIYNLPAGRRYDTGILIEPAAPAGADRSGAAQPIRLRFSGESAAGADGSVRELRRVETSLSRGSYRLTVTIRDLTTGAVASRSRTFDVHGRQRSAVMVAAMPNRGTRR